MNEEMIPIDPAAPQLIYCDGNGTIHYLEGDWQPSNLHPLDAELLQTRLRYFTVLLERHLHPIFTVPAPSIDL